jgi:hypothetical protein
MASTISAGTTLTTSLVQTADTSGVLQLQTNGGTTAVTIDTNQNVGIGTSSPTTKLQIAGNLTVNAGSGNTYGQFISGSSTIQIGTNGISQFIYGVGAIPLTFSTNAVEAMRIDSSSALLVGNTSNPGNNYKLLVATGGYFGLGVTTSNTVYMSSLGTGTVYSNGGTLTNTNPSDERLKENITNVSWGLEQISALRPVSYTWKNNLTNQGTQYGFIAQEVQAVMPELVREFETRNGEEVVIRFGLEKDGIYAAMIKAIQELAAQVTTLQTQVTALKG